MNAIEKAMAYLSRFSRTESQLTAYLRRKGYSDTETAEALAYLRERRFINDVSFGQNYIESRIRKMDGPLKIKQLLFAKGIPPGQITQLLQEHYPAELQQDVAAQLLLKRLQQKKLSTRAERQKLFQFVASRGFPRYVIMQAFDSLTEK